LFSTAYEIKRLFGKRFQLICLDGFLEDLSAKEVSPSLLALRSKAMAEGEETRQT